MARFSPRDLQALADSYATLQGRLNSLAEAYAFFPYKSQAGKNYSTQGFLRRFHTMHHCIERVFEIFAGTGRTTVRPHFVRRYSLHPVLRNEHLWRAR